MPVTERRARTDDDTRRHLALVTPEWSTQEVEVADKAIEDFFAALRHAFVDVDVDEVRAWG
jgi:hypothetical protein